jgi:hypothetical protein
MIELVLVMDIAEILLKVAVDIKNQIKKSNHICDKDS